MNNYYRRNLPHYQPSRGTFFITFRLANSLPKAVMARLKQEYKCSIEAKNQNKSKKRKIRKAYFKNFDQYLDRAESGRNWLKEDKIAQIVADKIHDFDSQKYTLICYCIMPNHVHLLVEISNEYERDDFRATKLLPLTDMLRLIKGSTAHEANKILNRGGQFWQHENYDHLIRDYNELERLIQYILQNPVKAGLVDNWQNWKWTYCKEKYLPVH